MKRSSGLILTSSVPSFQLQRHSLVLHWVGKINVCRTLWSVQMLKSDLYFRSGWKWRPCGSSAKPLHTQSIIFTWREPSLILRLCAVLLILDSKRCWLSVVSLTVYSSLRTFIRSSCSCTPTSLLWEDKRRNTHQRELSVNERGRLSSYYLLDHFHHRHVVIHLLYNKSRRDNLA